MANVQITQLPAAGTITGTEAVPIVQNGVTVQTTVGAITSGPALTQTFLTVNNEPTLANSRYISVGSGLSITDNGEMSSATDNWSLKAQIAPQSGVDITSLDFSQNIALLDNFN